MNVLRTHLADSKGKTDFRREHRTKKYPWWSWLHLCSLDAPLVALVWQHWWARLAGTELDWQRDVILALAVWMIYLADRWADTMAPAMSAHETARHTFYRDHRAMVGTVICALVTILVVVTPCWLTHREFAAGLGLLVLASGYFAMTHRWYRQGWTAVFPKEAAVGGLFALVSALFVLSHFRAVTGGMLLCLGEFAVACFLNCALITRWEQTERDFCDAASLLNAFPGVIVRLTAGCMALTFCALASSLAGRTSAFLPLAAASALLALLDRARSSLPLDMARVLADMALLTPLLFPTRL